MDDRIDVKALRQWILAISYEVVNNTNPGAFKQIDMSTLLPEQIERIKNEPT